jgi:hypothetical protein
VSSLVSLIRQERSRELEHWKLAAAQFRDLESIAPPQSWQSLEHYTGLALREALDRSAARLGTQAELLERKLRACPLGQEEQLRADFQELRNAFLRTETTLDFYSDALAMRAQPKLGALLRACDHFATRSMAEGLAPLGRQAPFALTYLDKGLGASILKAGLRLWDPAVENPVAAIKVVRHNMLRPTALIHETGHQVAHTLDWNRELAEAFRLGLRGCGNPVADLFENWAPEIAGDAYAFVHTGYAALAALRDVVAGTPSAVFQLLPGDPHPTAWLRVLLNVACCRHCYGQGPWDDLEAVWLADYPLARASSDLRQLYEACQRALPEVVNITLQKAFHAFGGRSLSRLIDPMRVSPAALARLRHEAGDAALTSSYWAWNEAIRLLAMSGYATGLGPQEARQAAEEQEKLMLRIGTLRIAA